MYYKRIELLKGVAILFILISNAINFWLISSGVIPLIIAFIILILDLFGATFYIFLNSFNISFLLEKKMGCIIDKKYRNKVLMQGFLLILLGFPFNMIINGLYGLPFNIWGWNIITFLGFSQIICYFAYKLVRWTRIIIAITIIVQTPFLREILFFYKDQNIIVQMLYFLLVSPYPYYSPLPYVAISFFSTVFGELIYEAKLLESKVAELNAIKSVLKYGIILLIVGLIIPLVELRIIITTYNYNPNEFPFLDMPSILQSQFIIFIPNLPEFLVRGIASNIFINMGISLLLIGLTLYIFYYKQKEGRLSRFLVLFGESSITLLFLQYLFLYLFYQVIPVWLIFFTLSFYIVGLGVVIYLWAKHAAWIPNVDKIIKRVVYKSQTKSIK
ncbi:MAG: hypothetical protein ACFFKA_20155 [Candidatus Thorarchaeota archaeon]